MQVLVAMTTQLMLRKTSVLSTQLTLAVKIPHEKNINLTLLETFKPKPSIKAVVLNDPINKCLIMNILLLYKPFHCDDFSFMNWFLDIIRMPKSVSMSVKCLKLQSGFSIGVTQRTEMLFKLHHSI